MRLNGARVESVFVRSPSHPHPLSPRPALYDCSAGLACWGISLPRALTFLKTQLPEGAFLNQKRGSPSGVIQVQRCPGLDRFGGREGISSKLSQALGSWGSLRPRERGPLPINAPLTPLQGPPGLLEPARDSPLPVVPTGSVRTSSQRVGPSVVGHAGQDLGYRLGGGCGGEPVTHLAAWPGLSPLASVFMT